VQRRRCGRAAHRTQRPQTQVEAHTQILTSCVGQAAPIRRALTIGASAIGLTMFDPHTFVDLFSSAGLVSVEQQAQFALQFVAAEKPG
jgi:hypothetical protein